MSNYTDDERAAILQAAYETLARKLPEVRYTPPQPEDRVAKWKREADESDAERERARRERTVEEIEGRLRAELAGMVEGERGFMMELLAEMLAHNQREISEAVGGLRAETNVARTIDKADNITELPNPLVRKTT